MKLNKKQLDNVFECLNGSKYENECIRELCEKSLETISIKLNDQQLNRVYNAFIYGLKDKYIWGHKSCAKPLDKIATKASEKQLEKFFNALMSGLKDEDHYVRKSCITLIHMKKHLKKFQRNGMKKQSEKVFNGLISVSKYLTDINDKSLAELLKKISTKLNDKQFIYW
ncbi:hypothetical protein RFI_31606 [Reticulomyxa filosa]|uniref:Uncharacterized protein n=1 Tax=Reticulomyxa filosa TaxID=46433 RepID=X6LV33_RETFI|nr:hypothetical protein RFI_31606 [Reticulomyxa filosa]|eukprot:ETO05788.1 hypothetical protein RFI_31606 [Reticulomyxa filosa]